MTVNVELGVNLTAVVDTQRAVLVSEGVLQGMSLKSRVFLCFSPNTMCTCRPARVAPPLSLPGQGDVRKLLAPTDYEGMDIGGFLNSSRLCFTQQRPLNDDAVPPRATTAQHSTALINVACVL